MSKLGIGNLRIDIEPLHSNVIVERDEAKSKSEGGIYLPDDAKEQPRTGTVLAVAKGTKEMPVTVKVGNKVLFSAYAGTKISGNENLLIMGMKDILAIMGKGAV